MAGQVRILSIDGGGIRGIIPAILLQRIEERCGQPIASLFHMIAGTSTGGIIAAGLGAPAKGRRSGPLMSAAELIDLYRDRGADIFRRDFWQGLRSLAGKLDEKYAADGLEKVLKDELGDLRLSQAIVDVLIPSYDLERRKPHFFKSWSAQGIDLADDDSAKRRDFLLRDAVRATTAAPTYFEPAHLKLEGESYALVDGGVFANNPAMCALASARRIYPKASRYLVLSLGTGETQRPIRYDDAKDWGLLGWARPVINVIFDGVSDTVDYQLEQELNTGGSVQRYFRFQTDLKITPDGEMRPNDDFDDASPENIRALERKAADMLRSEADQLNRLIGQLRRTPRDPLADLRG